jgi:probable HAF family extracellular repeat protein
VQCVLIAAFMLVAPIWAANYSTINLGVLPGTGNSTAIAVNDNGQIAGQSGFRAFFWDKHVMVDIGSLGGYQTTLSTSRQALNSVGQVVGSSSLAGGQPRAFVWQNGTMTNLGTLTGESNLSSSAAAINDAGQVVGTSGAYINGELVNHAVLWQNGAITDLGALFPGGNSAATGINASGQVIGWADIGGGLIHAIFWDSNGVMTDIGEVFTSCLAGGCPSYLTAINSSGDVVGHVVAGNSAGGGFLWSHGVISSLNELGSSTSPYTIPYAINDLREIVGESNYQPFLWQQNSGITALAVPNVYGSSGSGSAHDINRAGQVAGHADVGLHVQDAFLWQNGQASDLGAPFQGFLSVNAINNLGWIVGGNLIQAQATLWVPNQPPIADATATPTSVISPDNVAAIATLDGSRSADPDGDPLTYVWFVNGTQYFPPIGTTATVKWGVSLGSTTFRLDVNDGWVTASTSVTVTAITAGQAVNNLAVQVNAANIPNGVKNTLLGDLTAAASSFNKGSFKTGVNQLQTFISDVNAQLGKKIDVPTAAGLIGAAQAIISAVSAG